MPEWYNPETGQIENLPEEHLSPWEVAHGGERYDPDKEYERNDWDQKVEDYYANPSGYNGGVNLYDPSSIRKIGDPDKPLIEMTQPPPPPRGPGPVVKPPIPRPPSFGGGGGGQSSFVYDPFVPPPFEYGSFAPPAQTAGPFAAPSWDVGAPPAYEPYDYPEFEGPTAETFQTDPGYDFRVKEMERAVMNKKSAQGLLATGGTLKDLMNYRGGLASQEFGNVWNRQFTGHQANAAAALAEKERNDRMQLENYRLTYGAESDEYQRAVLEHNLKVEADREAFQRGLTTHLVGYGAEADKFSRALATHETNARGSAGAFGLNLGASQQRLAADQARWGNLLNLYEISTRGLPTYNPMTSFPESYYS